MTAGKRAHVFVHGKVQGVFYRAETQRAAKGAGVRGWVRNRTDGSVEALLEGGEGNVQTMLDWCRQGPLGARVDRMEVTWEDYVGDLVDFRVTF